MHTSGEILGIGVDVVEIEELERARFKKRVAEYFLTKRELAHVPAGRTAAQYLAARFSIKEAVIKAFPEKLSPHDFSIEKKAQCPTVVFLSRTRNEQYAVLISMTHTVRTAAAVALVLRRGAPDRP